jgi:hypothetical protein
LIELELWLQDSFTRALAEVQQTLAAMGERTAALAVSAQTFHDALHSAYEADWRASFYVHPEDAWWER